MSVGGTLQFSDDLHLWVWINEPQHAAAIQAILGIITTIGTIVAVISAWGAYKRTVEQLHIADEQLKLARRQANAAQRPFLVVELERTQIKGKSRPIKLLIVRNHGAGPVTDSYWIRESSNRVNLSNWAKIGSISVKGKAPLRLRGSEAFATTLETGILIHYKDLEGRVYLCSCTDSRLGTNCDNGELPP